MKVAVLHNLVSGGAHRRLAEQVAHLDAEIVEITTATAQPVTMRPIVVPLRPLARKVAPVLRPPLRYRDLREVGRAWRRMGELAEAAGADVVFANPDSFLMGSVDPATTLPVVRYCDEPRRIDHEPQLAATRNPATRQLYRDLHRRERDIDSRSVRGAERVLTNSAYTADRITTAYGVPAHVVVSGVPAVMSPKGPAAPRHLLSVGSLLRTKGHDLVVQAAAESGLELPVVVVALRGDEAEQRRLEELAAEHDVRLSFRIGITDAELAELYRGAFALLYLAQREPLGLASLEAQACGCPVIVADEGGLPETVVGAGNGLAVNRDARSAAAALRTLAASPPPRDGWGPLDLREATGWVLSAFELQGHFEAAVGKALGPVPDDARTPRAKVAPGRPALPTQSAPTELDEAH